MTKAASRAVNSILNLGLDLPGLNLLGLELGLNLLGLDLGLNFPGLDLGLNLGLNLILDLGVNLLSLNLLGLDLGLNVGLPSLNLLGLNLPGLDLGLDMGLDLGLNLLGSTLKDVYPQERKDVGSTMSFNVYPEGRISTGA